MAGESLAEAIEAARQRNRIGMLASLDHLGEHVSSPADAVVARDAYLQTLAEIVRQQLQSNISVKLTQLGLDSSEPECLANLRSVVDYAERNGRFVRVDMESSGYTDRTLARIIHEGTVNDR